MNVFLKMTLKAQIFENVKIAETPKMATNL